MTNCTIKNRFHGQKPFWLWLCVLLLGGFGPASVEATAVNPQAAGDAVHSNAFRTFAVQRVYQKLLGRAATPDEAAPLVAQLQNGGEAWTQVVATVAASPAYFQKAGNANPQYVAQLFADLVDRAPDSEDELPASVDFLKDNSRAQLAAVLADTDEFRANFAGIFYRALLNRAPNDTEATAAAAQLKQSGLDALAIALLSSAEYFQKSGGSPESWQNAINRDLNGATNNGGALSSPVSPTPPINGTRAPLVQALLGSLEYQTSLMQSQYQKFLHRAATPTELQQGLATMQNGAADDVLLMILTSDEYFNRAGGTTNGFLSRLSQDLIGKNSGKRGRPLTQDLLDLLSKKTDAPR